jgi:hypothetical protein
VFDRLHSEGRERRQRRDSWYIQKVEAEVAECTGPTPLSEISQRVVQKLGRGAEEGSAGERLYSEG